MELGRERVSQLTADNHPQISARPQIAVNRTAIASLAQHSGPGRIWLFLVAQLASLCALIATFQVEEPEGLERLLPLIFCGFILNSLAPQKLRLWIFLGCSLGAFSLMLGHQTVGFLSVGVVLIGVCHLPWPWRYRYLLLAALGVVLVAARVKWQGTELGFSLSLVGSVFAFRLISYLYGIKHERTPSSWPERLSYFFLLPNSVFLFFPVVEFATFRRTYYQGNPSEIYQKGLNWMFRGVIQLLLYRLVYYGFAPAPSAVNSFWGAAIFVLTSYLLYLRVSGLFHLIVGCLCLFGFNLPETHHRYYFASSFSDLWRRINIYWKEFMMTLCFYPIFMRLRRLGDRWALGLATGSVFVITWLLHSYQWLWLRGDFPLTVVDVIFWGMLGFLVVVNSLLEARGSRVRGNAGKLWTWGRAGRLSFQTLGMFTFMCTLWSLWSSSSVGEWVSVISWMKSGGLADWLMMAGGLLLVGLAGTAAVYWSRNRKVRPSNWTGTRIGILHFAATIALVVVAWGMRTDSVHALGVLPAEFFETGSQDGAAARGYYETLLIPAKALPGAVPSEDDAQRRGFLFPPNTRIQFDTSEFRTVAKINSLGFRGREMPVAHTGAYRVVAIGDSFTYGWGLQDGETWEEQLESRLNGKRVQVEVANLGRGGADLNQAEKVAEEVIPVLKPDLVIVAVSQGDDIAQVAQRMDTSPHRKSQISITTYRRLAADMARSMFPELMAARNTSQSRYETVLGANWRDDALNVIGSASRDDRARFASLGPEVRGLFESGKLNPAMLELMLRHPDYWRTTISPDERRLQSLVKEMGGELSRIDQLARRHGAEVIVVSMPFPAYVNKRGMQNVGRLGFDVTPRMYETSLADDVIEHAAAGAGLHFHSFTQEFRELENKGMALHYVFDCHLNPAGSALIARVLAPIVEQGISRRAQARNEDVKHKELQLPVRNKTFR